jgi:hypothetical protein
LVEKAGGDEEGEATDASAEGESAE